MNFGIISLGITGCEGERVRGGRGGVRERVRVVGDLISKYERYPRQQGQIPFVCPGQR